MTDLVIGAGIPITEPCKICGFPLLLNGKCRKEHSPKNKRRGRYSGKSNFWNYKDKSDFSEVGYAK